MYFVMLLSAIVYAVKRHLKFTGFINYLYLYSEIFHGASYDTVLPEKGKSNLIFDVGGNIGLYSLYLNEKYDDLKIHVFEPIPELYQFIRHNVLTNKKSSNKIHINNFGFSNKKETVKINYFPHASGLSTVQPDLDVKMNHIRSVTIKGGPIIRALLNPLVSFLAKTHFVAKPTKVNLIRISDYIRAHNIANIDILKVDVEGYELPVLQGIKDEDFAKIRAFQIEIENYRKDNQAKIIAILQKHNYKVSVKWANDSWSFIVATQKGTSIQKPLPNKPQFPFF